MIYSLKYSNRFSYDKTIEFWNLLDNMQNRISLKSIEHAIVSRDKIFFHLCYSYGLNPQEALCLSTIDLNLENINNVDIYGTLHTYSANGCNSRLLYPIFPESLKYLEEYLVLHSNFFSINNNKLLFITQNGNPLSIRYLHKRLKYYNSKLTLSHQIPSLYLFRQYYIADLLRIKGLSQSFINSQIGNNIIDNQLYFHLIPRK